MIVFGNRVFKEVEILSGVLIRRNLDRHAEERYCDNVGHLQMKERGLEQILS